MNKLDEDAARPWDWQDKVVFWGSVICMVIGLALLITNPDK